MLLQTVNAKQLSLEKVSADQSIVEGDMHVVLVDLSKQSQLQVLKLSHCKNIKISGLNTEQLMEVRINCSPGTMQLDLLLNACKVTELSFGDFFGDKFQYNSQIDDVVHTLNQLWTLTLINVDIDDNALTVTTAMKGLKYIGLNNTNMSLETWCTFVDSLLFLHQSVEVKTYDNVQEEKRDYVRMNPNFDVDPYYPFFYFTLKTRIKRDNSAQTTVSEILYKRNK
jgi:hypothetical protein